MVLARNRALLARVLIDPGDTGAVGNADLPPRALFRFPFVRAELCLGRFRTKMAWFPMRLMRFGCAAPSSLLVAQFPESDRAFAGRGSPTQLAKSARTDLPDPGTIPGALSYAGETPPSIRRPPERTVYMGISARCWRNHGLRLGYIVAPAALAAKLVQANGPPTCIPRHCRRWPCEVVRDGFLMHIPTIRALYRDQCAADARCPAAQYMPGRALEQSRAAGMFLWAELPQGMERVGRCWARAVEAERRFRSRCALLCRRPGARIAAPFVTVPPPRIEEGVKRLAESDPRQSVGPRSRAFGRGPRARRCKLRPGLADRRLRQAVAELDQVRPLVAGELVLRSRR